LAASRRGLALAQSGILDQLAALPAIMALTLACYGTAAAQPAPPMTNAVGVENQYADVISQIGGSYVKVSAIETDPNTDPHSFEVSPKIALQLAAADLVVENGIGYDSWADKMLAAAPHAGRQVINVQHLRGMPDSTPNPHLWYDPVTMPMVATALVADLSVLQPAHAEYFRANEARFDGALKPLTLAIAAFKTDFPGVAMAVTEPVGDDMLQALGADIMTPFSLQAAIMNGTDPSPQDVTAQDALFTGHKVKVLVYNQQVTDPLTQSFLGLAEKNDIPVVGVYETMPAPGYTYQSWMLAEVLALRRAVADNVSTETLMRKTPP